MNVRRLVLLGVAALLACVAAPAALVRAEPAPGRWDEVLSLAPDKSMGRAGVDAQGKVWLMVSRTLRFWDGAAFRTLENDPLKSGLSVEPSELVGGPDRGLFLASDGKVYALSAGQARYVADYYRKAGAGSVHVAADGRLMQWATGFITPDLTRPQDRREARLGSVAPVAFDDGANVRLLCEDRIYTIGADGAVTERPCALPKPKIKYSRKCAPWGPGKVLVLQDNDTPLMGLDLRTGELLDVRALADALAAQGKARGLAPMPDGSSLAWVSGGQDPIYRIPPGGMPQELPNGSAISWPYRLSLSWDGAWALGADGSIWLSGDGRGLLMYKDGQVRTWGWRDGIRIGWYYRLLRDGTGAIFAADGYGVYVYRPDGLPPALPPGYELWTEVPTDRWPVPDFKGGAWASLRDKPGRISHWDGERWADVEVGAGDASVWSLTPDDRGHLLLRLGGVADQWYDVSPRMARRCASFQGALQAAVADGARRFGGDSMFCCICADDRGRIWYGEAYPGSLHYFDGTAWHDASLPATIFEMYQSPQNGVVASTPYLDTYTWPQSPQPTHTVHTFTSPSRLLLGPTGLQPFEEELLRAEPDYYVPVDRDGEKYYLLRAEQHTGGVEYVRAGELKLEARMVSTFPALGGGLWLHEGNGRPARIFAGRVIVSDFSDTPLRPPAAGRVSFEDRAHNLWIGGSATFMKRLSGFRLRVGDAPGRVGRALTVEAALDLPGLKPGQGYVFWRIDGGDWQGGGPPGRIAVRFAEKGLRRVELLGMDPLGGTTPENVVLTVRATVPRPGTRLTARGPFTVNDVTWRPPVEAVPSGEGQGPALLCRLDDGEWQPLDGGVLLVGGLKPGAHAAEFAAVEEGQYRDPSPVRVEFTYAPDYDLIVSRRLDDLLGGDAIKSADAQRELSAVGQGALDALRRRLARLNSEEQAADRLRQVLLKLEEDQKPKPEPQPARPARPGGFRGFVPPRGLPSPAGPTPDGPVER